MASSVRESEEFIEKICCDCEKKGRMKEADFCCVNCANYYCTACLDVHAMIPSTGGHKMLGKRDFKSTFGSDVEILPTLPTQRCRLHNSKILDTYCKDHDEVVCATCVLEHRSCKQVMSIPEHIDTLYKKSEISSVKQTFSYYQETLKKIKAAKEKETDEVKTSLESAVNEVEAFGNKLRKILEEAEETAIVTLKKRSEKQLQSIDSKLSKVNCLLSSLEKVVAEMKSIEGKKTQEFVLLKTFNNLTAVVEGLCEQHNKQSAFAGISFTAYENLLTLVSDLGNINSEIKTQPIIRHSWLYKVTEKAEINVRMTNDREECLITGSCITEDGSLLLADGNNEKLKRLDHGTQKVRDYLSLKAGPTALCSIKNNEVAVSLDRNIVQIVSVGSQLTVTRALEFGHYCWGLAFHTGKLFIANSKSVYIYDLSTNRTRGLQRIATDAFENEILEETRHVAVGDIGDRIYVADVSGGLITLDTAGKHLSTLSEKDILVSGAYGTCTDGENVLVCGYNSGNVVQIRNDNTFVGEIDKVGSLPCSLCFDRHRNWLYVTGVGDQVTAMQLK